MPLTPQTADYDGVFNPGRERDKASTALDLAAMPDRTPVNFAGRSSSPLGAPVLTVSGVEHEETWSNARGHTLSYACLFLFSVVLYFRPYELIPALSSFTSIAFYTGLLTLAIFVITQLALEGNLTARPREVNLILLLALAALLSIPMASYPGEAWETFTENFLKAVLIFIVLVNVVRTERRLKWLILLALSVSVFLSVHAINDYRLGIFRVGSLDKARVGGVIGGLFGNSNDLAMHLVTMVPLAFVFGLATRNLISRLFYLLATTLLIAASIVTFSRGAFLALIAATLVLIRKLGRRNKSLAAGAVIFALVLFLVFGPASYFTRLASIFDPTEGSASQRTDILKRSVVVALRYPLFGVGLGNFHYKSIRELEAHNAYAQVATEMGLAALAFYVMLMVYPLRKLRKIEQELFESRSDKRIYYLAIGVQASLIAYMVASFFGSVAYQWYVYYLVGYAIGLRRIYSTQIKHFGFTSH